LLGVSDFPSYPVFPADVFSAADDTACAAPQQTGGRRSALDRTMTKNNRLSGMVMLLTVAAIALAGCSGREAQMPSGNGSDYRQIARDQG
jgi:hypothetical protein